MLIKTIGVFKRASITLVLVFSHEKGERDGGKLVRNTHHDTPMRGL